MPAKLALPTLLLMACVTPDETGVVDQEIVGGTRVTTTEFPTVVALQHGAGNWFCTGVLVDKDWVLTAASCFIDNSATQARIGDGDLTDGATNGATIAVASIYKHPQFSTSDTVWRHDVAVLRLAQSVTDRTPSPIRRDATALGASITQAGFGVSSNNGTGGGVLRSLGTTNIDCAGANAAGITNDNLLCFNAADGTGSCYGDGGAPAFVTGTHGRIVVGVGSGGTSSSCTQGLDIYTSLVPELTFIDTYVPVPGMPPPPNPPPPPPSDPDGGGSDGGSGGGPGREPDGGGGGGDGKREELQAGCNAGGNSGWLAVLGIVLAVVRRRRRAS